jgi:uncharacterized protein
VTLTVFNDSATITPEGWLKARAVVTGVGVLDYTNGPHAAMMYRPESEVFSQATMDSAKGVPITLRHPPGLITSNNTLDHLIGYTGDDVTRQGRDMLVNITIVDGPTVERMVAMAEAGQRIQFSMGYDAVKVNKAGIFDGKAYTVVQTQIRYNHVALLLDEAGRYPNTTLLLDAGETQYFILAMDSKIHFNNERETYMEFTMPDGTKIQVNDESDVKHLTNYVNAQKGIADSISTLKGEKTALERKLNAMQDSVAANTSKEAIKSTLQRITQAATVLGDSVTTDELLDMAPKAVYEKVLLADGYESSELTGLDEAELRGMFSVAVKNSSNSMAATDSLLSDLAASKTKAKAQGEGITDSAAAAYASQLDNLKKAGK